LAQKQKEAKAKKDNEKGTKTDEEKKDEENLK